MLLVDEQLAKRVSPGQNVNPELLFHFLLGLLSDPYITEDLIWLKLHAAKLATGASDQDMTLLLWAINEHRHR